MDSPRRSISIGYRHLVAVLIMTSTTMAYFGRMNLSTAIVAMVDHNSHPHPDNHSSTAKKFHWDEKTQGVILGSFFYGYFALQIITGRLAEIIGPRLLCSIGIASTGILNLLTPLAAESYGWFVASRVIMGSLQAGIFPCAFALAARWIPDHERSTVTSMAYIGGNLGTIIASAISGYLCKHGFAGGWPSVFYVTGIVELVICIIYFVLISDNPEDNWIISEDEIQYIKTNIGPSGAQERPPVPWLAIIKTPAVWAGTFSQFTMMWALTMMMLKLPDYVTNVMKVSVEKTGLFDAVMYAAESLSLFFGGILADILIKRSRPEKKTMIRKLFQGVASIGSSICLFYIPSIGSGDLNGFLALMIIAMLIIGFQSGGLIPIPADLTNEFSATLFGCFNMIAMINGFICPVIIGAILDADTKQQHRQWSYVWYLTATLRLVGGIIFLLFGSAKRQSWDFVRE